MVQLARVTEALPGGFDALRAEAEADGYRHLTRLAQEWAEAREGFVAVLAAFVGGELAGIGALTPEPAGPGLRMRRLHVARAFRRQGVGRAIASALLQEALGQTGRVTVHAGNPEAAAFWEAQDFRPVAGRPWSHVYSAA